MSRIPPTIHRYLVPRRVLEDSWTFLQEGGEHGFEAVAVWIGRVVDDSTARVVAAARPGQVAYRGELGCAVEVPPDELSRLISVLPDDHFVLARLHTHPTEAYHSELDDMNMLIGHRGAISIVVPDFARLPLELTCCSVNELRHEMGWIELSQAEVSERFAVDG